MRKTKNWYRRIGVIFICISLLTGGFGMPITAAPGTDLVSFEATGFAVNWDSVQSVGYPDPFSGRDPSRAFSENWNNTENYWSCYLSERVMATPPWYIVDLGNAYNLSLIEFTGRKPGATDNATRQAERRNFEVQVSNDFSFGDYEVIGSQGSSYYGHGQLWKGNINLPDKYRYIRIIKTANENLSLTGLKVYGTLASLPVAVDLSVIGSLAVGETVEVTYSYNHEGGTEGDSKIEWFTSTTAGSTADATSVSIKYGDPTYRITSADHGKYLFCTVTPYSTAVEDNIGAPVTVYTHMAVKASKTTPGVLITAPAEGATLPSGSNPVFAVDIEIADATVTKVEYFINGNNVGESTAAPSYSFEWTDGSDGNYVLRAEAHNSLGDIGISKEVSFRIMDNVGPYPLIGTIHKRMSSEISGRWFSIGSETLDRDYATYKNYMEYVGRSGANFMRLQGGWAKCETVKGEYDWAWLDESIDHALSVGVMPWVNTCYGNSLYAGGGDETLDAGLPTSPEALQAWDNWVTAMVTRYKDKVKYWEIWNEADHGSVTMGQYVNFFIRTSDIIRSVQPDSKIIGLAASKTGWSGGSVQPFLSQLKSAGKIDNVDIVTIHGYPTDPDTSSYNTIKNEIKRLYPSNNIELWNGETGMVDKAGGTGALSGFNSSQTIQQKWIARRMLSGRSLDVPISIFCLVDLHYPNNQTNLKGLIWTNKADQTVIGPKPAYDTYRNVASIFDNTLEKIPTYEYTRTGSTADIRVSGYENVNTKKQVVTVWTTGTPGNSLTTTPMTFTFTGGNFDDPVYVDMRDGKVYQMNKWSKSGNTYTFNDVPVYDSAILIADKSTLAYDPIGIAVENAFLYNSDGVSGVSDRLSDESTIIAKALVSNTGAGFADLSVILALYNESNELISISKSTSPTRISAGVKDVSISASMTLTEKQKLDAAKAKLMVWNMDNLRSYTSKVYVKDFE